MRFVPKTEEEVSNFTVPEGVYDFEIVNAIDTVSKSSGNDMIKLMINFYDNEGKLKSIDDYLLESMAYKLRHAAEACGLLKKYESGELEAEDFVGKTGKFKLVISKGRPKPDGGVYPDKNDVKDYIIDGKATKPVKAKPAVDDGIPF